MIKRFFSLFSLLAFFALMYTYGLESKADESRKRAIDFEIPAYFPSEWESVETQYEAARAMPQSTQNEIQKASALIDNISNAYDDLFRKTIPLYAQAREDEIISIRDELISTGFTDYFPKFLRNADKKALAALEKYETKDFYKARDTAAEALNEYETLFIGANIFLGRKEIIEHGFAANNTVDFDKADEIAQKAIYEYEAGNKEAALANAEKALLCYNLLLN